MNDALEGISVLVLIGPIDQIHSGTQLSLVWDARAGKNGHECAQHCQREHRDDSERRSLEHIVTPGYADTPPSAAALDRVRPGGTLAHKLFQHPWFRPVVARF